MTIEWTIAVTPNAATGHVLGFRERALMDTPGNGGAASRAIGVGKRESSLLRLGTRVDPNGSMIIRADCAQRRGPGHPSPEPVVRTVVGRPSMM
jgi:hypothetical protein